MKKGFTLIELLIVVAIIAILAAIAVPNFLQAQTRSKVSRCHADMRSIANAIEEYATDWNRAPLDQWEWTQVAAGSGGAEVSWDEVYSHLTTPIAYITSIPHDPFIEKGNIDKQSGPAGFRKVYRLTTMYVAPTGMDRAPRKNARQMGYVWVLDSLGPSRDGSKIDDPTKRLRPDMIISGTWPLWTYDATNGTVSYGLIMRTNKGIYGGEDHP